MGANLYQNCLRVRNLLFFFNKKRKALKAAVAPLVAPSWGAIQLNIQVLSSSKIYGMKEGAKTLTLERK